MVQCYKNPYFSISVFPYIRISVYPYFRIFVFSYFRISIIRNAENGTIEVHRTQAGNTKKIVVLRK